VHYEIDVKQIIEDVIIFKMHDLMHKSGKSILAGSIWNDSKRR
jgi:hypothetical protein